MKNGQIDKLFISDATLKGGPSGDGGETPSA